MIGPTELVFVLFLLVSLYFVLKPPAWYNKSKKKAFISQYGGIVEQKKFRSLVAEIGLTIARAANYPEEALDFQVLKSPIPNAFAWNALRCRKRKRSYCFPLRSRNRLIPYCFCLGSIYSECFCSITMGSLYSDAFAALQWEAFIRMLLHHFNGKHLFPA